MTSSAPLPNLGTVPTPHSVQGEWIWVDDSAESDRRRVDRVRFRRCVELLRIPTTALLHLSARLQYHLRVNGQTVGVGPVRSYPESREFDTHDLRQHLRCGANAIDVEVLHWDLATFHNLREPPGFVAWGEIRDLGDEMHALHTPGDWLCQRIQGIAGDAPRLSFAQGPVEIVDRRADLDVAWRAPVPAEAGLTPTLTPRGIPPLTQTPMPAVAVAVSAVDDGEVTYAVRVTFDGPDKGIADPPRDWRAALAAWIHSPVAQTVSAGVWWGEFWLNGTRLVVRPAPGVPLRQGLDLPLQVGWNHLVVGQGISFGYAEFCFAWARNAGLRLRAERVLDGPDAVWLSGPLRSSELERHWEGLLSGERPAATEFHWRNVPTGEVPLSPLRRVAWARLAGPLAASVLPLTIRAGVPTLVTLDMGQIVLGRLALEVDAPSDTVLDVVHAEERLGDRAHVGKAVTVYGADRWTLAGGRQRVESFSPRGFRYLDVLVSGHRSDVTLRAAGGIEQRYPYAFSGEFACSDEDFNRLWAYGRRTLELCSEDVFTDCPWRERTLYGGDLLPEMATAAVLTRDLRLVRRSLEVFLQSLNPETGGLQSRVPKSRTGSALREYPLLTAVAAAWYLRLTGDVLFARQAWPVFAAMAAAAERSRRDDGLYVPSAPSFIDHGRRVTAGPTSALNAALVAAFAAWSEIARAAGETAAAEELTRCGDALDARMVSAYFDRAAGTFRDLPLADGGNATEGSPANSWPLLFCPSVRREAPTVLAALGRTLDAFSPEHEPDSVSPYQMFYLLSALRDHGAAELAETTIRRVYAGMLAHPTGTLWEVSRPMQSLVHAWSSGTSHYFATAVLGVRLGLGGPAELARVLIAPCAAAITWARGVVPHPLGDVEVAWERRADGLHVSVRAPAGVPVDVVPTGPLAGLPCHVVRA